MEKKFLIIVDMQKDFIDGALGSAEAQAIVGAAAAFDRRGYKYHGRLAALADAARDAGLNLGAKGDNAPKKVAAQSGAAKKAAKAEAKAAKAKGAKK